MDEAEEFLLAFHRVHPGCTSEAFAAGVCYGEGLSSYGLLAMLAAAGPIVDLGCGDGFLMGLLHERVPQELVVGLDFSPAELARARSCVPGAKLVRGAGQALPFADHSVALVVSHLAFHLMSDVERVVDEIARVLRPGGRFAAIVGGGPKMGDAFELFLELLSKSQSARAKVPRIGDMRARTDSGLHTLFATHPSFCDLQIDDHYVDFGGDFAQLWPRLLTVYDLVHYSDTELETLRDAFHKALGVSASEHIPCTMAIRRVVCERRSARLASTSVFGD